MKPSDVEIVSFEISHVSLAMIKLKSNGLFFGHAMWISVFHITGSAQNKRVAQDHITVGFH